MPHRAVIAAPPEVPPGTPSQLLERRPDIAAAERRMAAANAAIGLAQSAYFPTVSLIGSQCATQTTEGSCAGFISSTLGNLLAWPSRVWAIGASAAEVLFDGGQRGANVHLATAQYTATVAAYRQAVLDAFQQVEQSLAQVRGVGEQAELQRTAVALAQRALELERGRFQRGLDPYIDLALQQTALLSAQLTLTDLQVLEMTSTVALIEALGGGWNRSELPR